MTAGKFSKIRFGAGLAVADEGGGVITVSTGGGTGGGPLEWSDVGVPGSGFTDPWVRYAIVQGSSLVAGTGSEVRVLWSSVFGYSPEGALCDLAATGGAAAGHHIRLLKAGFYDVKIRLFWNSLQTPAYYGWGITGDAVEYGTNLVAMQHALAGGATGYPYVQFNTQITTSSSVPRYFRFQTSAGSVPTWSGMSAVALITRLSATAS